MKRVITVPFLSIIALFFGACSSSNNISNNTINTTTELEKKVQGALSNQERLYHLMQGTFVNYTTNAGGSAPYVWVTETDQDSAITCVQPIGEPNKEGYLLMHYTFLTHVPDKPLTNFILKIEQVSRDTLVILSYSVPKVYSLKDILENKIDEDVHVKEYFGASGKKQGTYVKVDNTNFSFSTPYERYVYAGENPKTEFYETLGSINLDRKKITYVFYNADKKNTLNQVNYEVRRTHIDLQKLSTREE